MNPELRQVLDALLEGVIVVDEWGIVRQLNDEACRVLGTSAEAMAGQSIDELHGPDHALARLARTALDTARAVVEGEERIERRLEQDVTAEISAAPIFDELGNVDGAVIVLRDRTLRSAMEQDVAERERLAWSGHVALGIAHEVKNPLGGIRGAAELLAARAPDPRSRETAELIVREAGRIARLVDDFLVLARSEELRGGEVNLHQVLDEALDLLGHDPVAAECKVVRTYDPSIPEIPGDAPRLLQVFLNLARNAFEAMAPSGGGTLTVSTRMSLEHRLTTAEGLPRPTVLVELRDTGPGIPEESRDQAATPFFTTRKEGTGLGLPLADHWVTRHEGRLRLGADPEGGLSVKVFLPARRTKPSEAAGREGP